MAGRGDGRVQCTRPILLLGVLTLGLCMLRFEADTFTVLTSSLAVGYSGLAFSARDPIIKSACGAYAALTCPPEPADDFRLRFIHRHQHPSDCRHAR
jgi:hypothetical protein